MVDRGHQKFNSNMPENRNHLFAYSPIPSPVHDMHIDALQAYATRSGTPSRQLSSGWRGISELLMRRPRRSRIFIQSAGPANLLFVPLARVMNCSVVYYLHEPSTWLSKRRSEGFIKGTAMHVVQLSDCILSTNIIVSSQKLKAYASKAYGLKPSKFSIAPLLMPEIVAPETRSPRRITYLGRPDKRRYLIEFIKNSNLFLSRGLVPTILTGHPEKLEKITQGIDMHEIDIFAVSRFPESLKYDILTETKIIWNPKSIGISQSGVTADAIRFGLISILTDNDPAFSSLKDAGLAVEMDRFVNPTFDMRQLRDARAARKIAQDIFSREHGYEAFLKQYLPVLQFEK